MGLVCEDERFASSPTAIPLVGRQLRKCCPEGLGYILYVVYAYRTYVCSGMCVVVYVQWCVCSSMCMICLYVYQCLHYFFHLCLCQLCDMINLIYFGSCPFIVNDQTTHNIYIKKWGLKYTVGSLRIFTQKYWCWNFSLYLMRRFCFYKAAKKLQSFSQKSFLVQNMILTGLSTTRI